jgi:hypothetical protein
MHFKLFLIISFIIKTISSFASGDITYTVNQRFFDSLENRVTYFEGILPELKQKRSPQYLSTRQLLEKTEFVLQFERFVYDQEFAQAKELTQVKIIHAQINRDKAGETFYKLYDDRVNRMVKDQKMYYQMLFAKEKNIRKKINKIIRPGTLEAYQSGRREVLSGLKYAREARLRKIENILQQQLDYINALILDEESEFDLEQITFSEKYFFERFNVLVKSDNLDLILKADTLLVKAKRYAELMHTDIDTSFFGKQQRVIITARSDYHYQKGLALDTLANEVVQGKLSAINRNGVYNWHNYILVIGEFNFGSGFKNVNRGEAVLSADKKLLQYIRMNKLADVDEGLEVGQAFLVPYMVDQRKQYFLENPKSKKLQYMVCYTMIENKKTMEGIVRYLKPINFVGASPGDDLAAELPR